MPKVEALEDRIALIATATTVISSPDPSTFGQAVTFTAAVQDVLGSAVTIGTVEFSIGNSDFGPETLNSSGSASLSDSGLSSGTYPVSATYSGVPGAYGGSTGAENGGQIVDEAAAITSPASATFTTGTAGSFTVTASGFPAPTLSESSATSLTSLGLSFNASTGVLSGTPAPDTGGTYGLTVTASNGVGTDAIQNFSLTIEQPPAITSVDNATFVDGVPGLFIVRAAGSPPPTLSESGALPGGVAFDSSTGVLSGTPATTDLGGVYTVTFIAANGVGSGATQSFFLVVDQQAAITSADNTTFVDGSPGSFTVTAIGTPPPTLSELGALPSGVSFDASTGVLSGTPATTDLGGVYTVTLIAASGFGPNAIQSFFLVVDQQAAFTSADNTTFVAGSPDSFTVTAIGTPPPALSESGALPSGVTFDPTTGSLSGTPAANAVGFYPLTFTASNRVGSAVTQNFGLGVVSPNQLLTAPTQFVVTGVTTTSVAFTWTDNDPRATSYEVQEAVVGSTNFAPVSGSPLGPGAHRCHGEWTHERHELSIRSSGRKRDRPQRLADERRHRDTGVHGDKRVGRP